MKNLGILCLLLQICIINVAAKDIHEDDNVIVRVQDGTTKEGLIGAVLCWEKKHYVTNHKGEIYMPYSAGMKVTVSFLGYKTITKQIFLNKQRKSVVINMQEDSFLINEVSVTGIQRMTNSTQQSFRLSNTLLERNTSLSLSQILEKTPGVSMISSGGTIAKPVIQGMHSSRILLINNGVRLGTQSWGEDHAPEIDHTGNNLIEVIKGAETVRYGYGAVGGVVLFNQAPLPFNAEKRPVSCKMNMGYSSNGNKYDVVSTVQYGIKHFAFRVHGLFQKAGDYSTAHYVLNNTGFTTVSFSGMCGYKNKKFTATLFSSLYSNRSGIYYCSNISDIDQLLARFERGRPDEETICPASYKVIPPLQQTQHFTIKGNVRYDFNDDYSLEITVSHQNNIRQEFENRKETAMSWLPVQDLELRSFSTDLLWKGNLKKFGRAQMGVSGFYQENFNVPGTKYPAYIPNYAAMTLGTFYIHNIQLDRLLFSCGLRYDIRAMDVNGYSNLNSFKYYKDFKIYRNLTGHVAASYSLTPKIKLRINIGWSWRPPEINELYASGLHHGTYWAVGNKDLKAETGYKAIIGGEYQGRLLRIDGSMFYQNIDNYIYDNIGEGINRFHNHPSGKYPQFFYGQDHAHFFGGDFTATVSPIQGLDLSVKGEWIYARNLTQDNWLPFMPSDRYTITASYNKRLSKSGILFSCLLESLFVCQQKRFDPEKDLVPTTPPAYHLLRAEAELDFPIKNKKLKMIFVGENMLNSQFKEYTDRFRYYAHGAGSNFSLKSVFEF